MSYDRKFEIECGSDPRDVGSDYSADHSLIRRPAQHFSADGKTTDIGRMHLGALQARRDKRLMVITKEKASA